MEEIMKVKTINKTYSALIGRNFEMPNAPYSIPLRTV